MDGAHRSACVVLRRAKYPDPSGKPGQMYWDGPG
jgi:hypothetical protein